MEVKFHAETGVFLDDTMDLELQPDGKYEGILRPASIKNLVQIILAIVCPPIPGRPGCPMPPLDFDPAVQVESLT